MECASMDERLQGYRDALEEAGIAVDERLIVRGNDNLLHRNPDLEELRRMRSQIEAAGEFTCYYALNSRLLYSGVKVLSDLGLAGKVCVSSHDEVKKSVEPFSDEFIHAVQPCYKMGWEAARILLDHITHPEAPIVQMTLKAAIEHPTSAAISR
jgi:DNA-binding LacI/PurR family transcriptional regulator